MTQAAYPAIEPFRHFMMERDHGHRIYVELCGNPGGIPVLFVHGGPGAGCSEQDRCFFDPTRYLVVLFDQRGSGRSEPLGNTHHNTTSDLIEDIEAIRRDLGIDQWVVFGGSWGSTLGLLYAQAHTDRILSLVLRGIFFATRAENHWLWQEGMSHVFPEAYARYRDFIPAEERRDLLAAYHRRLIGEDKAVRHEAALSIMAWESVAIAIDPDINASYSDKISVPQGLIETHYLANGCFIDEGQVEANLGRLRDIPTHIVHGRLDLITTCDKAWRLHQALPGSHLTLVPNAAHASREPGILAALVAATDTIADQLNVDSPKSSSSA